MTLSEPPNDRVRMLANVKRAIGSLPFTTADQGRRLYEHVRSTRPKTVLNIGTAHGVSAAYIGAALAANGAGMVRSIDHDRAAWDPAPEELIARAGLGEVVELTTHSESDYTWYLKALIEKRSDAAGNCEPLFDFCYLDGAHTWTVDALAVTLIERLLTPGGWLLMDDLDWAIGDHVETPPQETVEEALGSLDLFASTGWDPGSGFGYGLFPTAWTMTRQERNRRQLKDVFEVIVKPHPSFTDLRIEDGNWGWARKARGEARRLKLESSRPLSAVLQARLRSLHRRALRSRRDRPKS